MRRQKRSGAQAVVQGWRGAMAGMLWRDAEGVRQAVQAGELAALAIMSTELFQQAGARGSAVAAATSGSSG